MRRIFLSPPHMSGNELNYIHKAFDENYIAPLGSNVDQFEYEIEKYSGASHALVTNSGTAAIHLALILAGVGPGDIVLCQSLTFAASANPIRYLGAIPYFIDSEENSWNMDPDLMEDAILKCMTGNAHQTCLGAPDGRNQLLSKLIKPKKPKAIIPVHLYGMPANMDRIIKIAKKYDIPVIEDAAEALGSRYFGQMCGTISDFGIYSFNGNKIITTSAGGALITSKMIYQKTALKLASQAREKALHYEHKFIGYNYRMSNVIAGIGIAQIQVIEDRVQKRRENYFRYRENFKNIPEIKFQQEPEGSYSNRWLTAILLPKSEFDEKSLKSVFQSLEELNIETRPIWKPMHLQPVFERFPREVSGVSQHLFETGLCLPSGSSMSLEEIDFVSEKVMNLLYKTEKISS